MADLKQVLGEGGVWSIVCRKTLGGWPDEPLPTVTGPESATLLRFGTQSLLFTSVPTATNRDSDRLGGRTPRPPRST